MEKKKRRVFTNADSRHIVEQIHRYDRTQVDVASTLDICQPSVSNVLSDYFSAMNVEVTTRALPRRLKYILEQVYRDDRTKSEVARELDYTTPAIRYQLQQFFKAMGLEMPLDKPGRRTQKNLEESTIDK
ncbi:MAG: hypothetical protein FWE31_02195 [Firmicutes bacterium]|nr:hypothetical protein [Bacillota bacterium]